ncbi:MAG: DJ-1/PfpI family protein [Clostridiales bacterium]|nr:DJ-1/PfpI family protein [Clostridiales bacterium]
MAEAYVFLADGFEEIEGLTVVDLLRRAGVDTQMVSCMDHIVITGSHGIEVKADLLFNEADAASAQLFVLPGGMPGTKHLAAHEGLAQLLKEQTAAGKKIAAICAAPSVLGGLGLLAGKTAVCYPGFEEQLKGATVTENAVEVCGNVTTSRGMGTAVPCGLSLVGQLRGQKPADELAKGIIFA